MARSCILAVILVVAAGSGCVGVEAAVIKPTADELISDALQSMSRPENKALLHQLLQDEVLDQTAARLAGSFANGLLLTLSEREKRDLIDDMVKQVVKTASLELSLSLKRDLGPAVDDVAAGATERALGTALSSRTEEAVARIAARTGDALSEAVVRGVARSLDQISNSDLGASLRADVGVVVKQELEAAKPVIAAIGREGVKEALEGTAEELEGDLGKALRQEVTEDEQAVLKTAERQLQPILVAEESKLAPWLWGALGLLSLLLVVVGYGFVHHRRRGDEHERALARVAGAMRQHEDQQSIEALVAALRQAKAQEDQDPLAAFLNAAKGPDAKG